jgi:hypothetical protein
MNGKLRPPAIVEITGLSVKEVDEYLVLLVDSYYIRTFILEDGITLADKHINEEREAIEKNPTPMSTLEIKKLRKNITEKRRIALENNEGLLTKRKIVFDYDQVENKKVKLDGNDLVNKDSTFVVNFERFHIEKRNDDISRLASNSINSSAGIIMSEFFNVLLPNMHRVKEKKSRKYFTND